MRLLVTQATAVAVALAVCAHQHVDDKERQEPAHVAQAHCIANPAAVVIKASHAPGALHDGLGAALVWMGPWCIRWWLE